MRTMIAMMALAFMFSIPFLLGGAPRVSMVQNQKFIGADYREFDLPQPDPNICMDACQREQQCVAYTFVKPGVEGAVARCHLKYKVPKSAWDLNCISGVKE